MNFLGGWVLFLGLSLSSFYAFPSGLPQPSDFVMIPFIALMLLMGLRDDRGLLQHRFILIWLAMVSWVTLVSLAWTALYQSTGFLLFQMFFLYNLLLGVSLARFLFAAPSALMVIRLALVIALLVAFSAVLLDLLTGRARATGTFNNPNQLAYFSLCALVVVLASYGFRPKVSPLPVLATVAVIGNILAASSLGAMGGLCLVGLAWVMANMGKARQVLRLLLLVPVLLVSLFVLDTWTGGQVQDNLDRRFDRAPEKVDGIYADRKYERIVVFWEYNLLGAGEGNRERFRPFGGNEIHSSFGTMLFSYGLPGLALFIALLLAALWRAPLYFWIAASGPLLYSVTHNGLRTTLFWIMLVVLWHCRQRWHEAPARTSVSRPIVSSGLPWLTGP
ncbi:hypothetical protein [Halomonas sp. 11-S5]|uniref:hypothetical protein n=1 Tax=Halomonas sp. 11-S5 TaxID=2994064 RepID=UPI0024686CA0|nr:hypothetical protein [Halomonas sp. 11-S5]